MESAPDERIASNLIVCLIRVSLVAAIGCGVLVVRPAMAQGSGSPADISAETNITGDSAKGWLPSATLRKEAVTTAGDYFSMLADEKYDDAYGMMSEANRRSVPVRQFAQQNHEFHDKAGPLKRRDMLKVTWTKDPVAGPFPGVYAAIDVASYFANIDRHCGYIVLYQKPDGGRFEVMRQEANFIDNATAQKIEMQKSRAVLDAIWAKLAANCPNYRPMGSPAAKP